MKPWTRIWLALALIGVMVSTSLPNWGVAWLRSKSMLFNQSIWFFEKMYLPFSLAHLLVFMLLGLLSTMALGWQRWRQSWLALMAFAALTELMQVFAPGRTPRFTDLLVDAVGISTGIGLGLLARVIWQGLRRKLCP